MTYNNDSLISIQLISTDTNCKENFPSSLIFSLLSFFFYFYFNETLEVYLGNTKLNGKDDDKEDIYIYETGYDKRLL